MDYLKLFIVNGLFGYYLQAIGYVLMIWAFGRRKIRAKDFFLASAIFGILMYGIRSLNMISFGFHTILIMILFILIATKVFHNQVYSTALAVMVTVILILLCEIITFGCLHIWIDADTLSSIMKNDQSIQNQITKAQLGIPANVIQIAVTYLVYRFKIRKKREA